MIEDAYIKKKVKDYEIYYSELNKEQYDFTNKDINFISNNENSGFGVRILKNKRIGFASTNTNNLKKCIDKAIEICSLNNENNNFKNFALPSEKYTNVNSLIISEAASLAFLIAIMRALCSEAADSNVA